MPDVSPPELVEMREEMRRTLEENWTAHLPPYGPTEFQMPMDKPPRCGICEIDIDGEVEDYVIGLDESWAHASCVDAIPKRHA